MTRQDLFDLFAINGNTGNLDTCGARSFEATENFELDKTPSRDYDFLIRNHNFTWGLDSSSDEERKKLMAEKLENIKDALVEKICL